MGGPTREETEELIEQDTGAIEDEVWIMKQHRKGRQTYHDDRECQSLQKVDECRSLPREQAQRRIFAPCQWCVIGSPEKA